VLLINGDQIAFLLHAVNNRLFNELLDDRGVSSVSHNVDLLWVRWNSVMASDHSLSLMAVDPQSSSFEFDEVVI
jgi:hypothetical protein